MLFFVFSKQALYLKKNHFWAFSGTAIGSWNHWWRNKEKIPSGMWLLQFAWKLYMEETLLAVVGIDTFIWVLQLTVSLNICSMLTKFTKCFVMLQKNACIWGYPQLLLFEGLNCFIALKDHSVVNAAWIGRRLDR